MFVHNIKALPHHKMVYANHTETFPKHIVKRAHSIKTLPHHILMYANHIKTFSHHIIKFAHHTCNKLTQHHTERHQKAVKAFHKLWLSYNYAILILSNGKYHILILGTMGKRHRIQTVT